MGINSRDLVKDKAFKFLRRTDELRSKEYYSDDPKKLISFFGEVVKQISESIENLDPKDSIRIKRINLLLSFYHYCLDEIEHIEVGNVPVEMLPLFSRILEKLELKTIFVFRPNPMYNYSHYPITRVVKEIHKSQRYPEIKAKYDIAVISFPSSEKNSALLHCSFAHEVGHHINESFSIAKEIEPKILELIDKKLLEKYVTRLMESLSRTKRVVGETEVTLDKFILKEQLIARLTEEFAGIIRRWLDELISDIVALHLFGPAFVFAIAESLISRQDSEKYSKTHPPLFLRLKTLMNLFDESGFSQDLKPYSHVMKRIAYYKKISKKTFESAHETELNLKNMILEREIMSLFELAKSRIKSKIKLPKKAYKISDVRHSVFALRNLIPGNEILDKKSQTSRPIDAVSILNAAWIVRIEYIDELYTLLPKIEKPVVRNILDELTLKSLDLQEFHSKMM